MDLHATLTALLDCLIPADPARGLPSAGALALAGTVRERLGDAVAMLQPGLEALDAAAAARGHDAFTSLSPEARDAVLREVADREPGLVPALVFHTYSAYYAHPEVLEALGMEGRPPHPKGYALEPGDLTLLEPVRARGRIYRESGASKR